MTAPVFPFRPNWRRPLVERLEWLTDVLTARSGAEDRTAMRLHPRRSMEFEALVHTSALQRLDALLWAYGGGQYVLPIWTDPQQLASTLSSGASSIPCDTAGYDFAAGAYAVLWRNDAQYEAVEIDTVGASSLTLVGATAQTWPAGTRLLPGRLARLPDDVRAPRASAAVAQPMFTFELDNTGIASAPDATLYRSAEVSLRRPNWESGVPVRYRRTFDRVDYGLGAIFVDDLTGLAYTVRTHRHLLNGRDDIAAFRGWLHARRGRAVAYWQPQWQADFTLAGGVTSAGTTITVEALGAAAYDSDAGRQDVALRNRTTGQWTFRRVTGVTPGAGTETLQLDGAVGFTAAAGDVFATWLCLSRLEADAIELAWHSAGVAVSLFDIRSVQQ